MGINFTITDLKKHLGPGLGLRKNKYLLELPVPGIAGASLNILCRSAGLPERNITTSTIYHKGRKYNVRGETDYTGTYEISLVDDSDMQIRTIFDKWLKQIDNSKPKNSGIVGASFEEIAPGLLDNIKDGVTAINQAKTTLENPNDFIIGLLDEGIGTSSAAYQTDVNIWQLDSYGEKVKGYKLQNCFPSSLGIVTLEDGDENTLSEFSVTLTYSEFIPLVNESLGDGLLKAALGDNINDTVDGIKNI